MLYTGSICVISNECSDLSKSRFNSVLLVFNTFILVQVHIGQILEKERTMAIPRTFFFLALVLILATTLFSGKMVWLLDSEETTGIFSFQGRGNALDQIRSGYSFCYFKKGNDTIWFKGAESLKLKEGAIIKVRYQRNNPADARVFSFRGFWRGTIIYGIIVFLVILVVFLNKEVLPRGSSIGFPNKKALIYII